jgi:rhodanese-related sulfurtransferase
MSFGMDGSMATYFGWMFPYDEQLVLISDKASDVAEAQRELVRIGIDRPAGSFVGEVAEFGDPKSTRAVSFKDVPAVIGTSGVHVLDVRRTSEREASHIEPSLHIPLHELEGRVNELPTDGEIWVHCAGAYRAAAALGIIENSKRTAVLINEPYESCLSVDGLKIVTGHMDAGPVSPSDVVANV